MCQQSSLSLSSSSSSSLPLLKPHSIDRIGFISLFLNMLLNTVYAAKEDSLFWIMVHQTSKNVSHATLHFYPAISPWVVGTAKRMSNVKFQLFPRGLAKWLKNLLSLMLSRISLGLDILAHMAVTSRLHLPLTHNLPPYLLYQ